MNIHSILLFIHSFYIYTLSFYKKTVHFRSFTENISMRMKLLPTQGSFWDTSCENVPSYMRAVWSESSFSNLNHPKCTQWRFWLDYADQNLRWTYISIWRYVLWRLGSYFHVILQPFTVDKSVFMILHFFQAYTIWNVGYMGSIKRKSAFEHACADSDYPVQACSNYPSGPLFSSHTYCGIQWFCKRTVKALVRLRGCAGWSGPSLSAYAWRQVFAWHGQSQW